MKVFSRRMIALATSCILLGAAIAIAKSDTAFRRPTDEQIETIAKDPSLLRDYIENATVDQSVQILIRIIARLDSFQDISVEVKRTRIAELFEVVRQVHPDTAGAIIARVLKKVNPRLLPIIRTGTPAPPYSGQ